MWQNSLIDFKFGRRGLHIVTAVLFIFSSSCSNKFETFADKTTNESLYFSARENIRLADYDNAILDCGYMSGSFAAKPYVAEVCATAYAGRCGFMALTVATDLSTASAPLFKYFMGKVSGVTSQKITDCDTAINTLRGIGSAAVRSNDENALMILLSLWTIASTVDKYADVTDGSDDGVLDPAFDACAAGKLSAANAQVIGKAFWELNKSATALSGNAAYTALSTAVGAMCTALGVLAEDLCNSTTPTALNAAELKGARSLVKEGAATGVDQCGGSTSIVTCNCP